MLAVLICGLSGFSDFHKADWLQHILRLQDEEVGCFGRDSEYHKTCYSLLKYMFLVKNTKYVKPQKYSNSVF